MRLYLEEGGGQGGPFQDGVTHPCKELSSEGIVHACLKTEKGEKGLIQRERESDVCRRGNHKNLSGGRGNNNFEQGGREGG